MNHDATPNLRWTDVSDAGEVRFSAEANTVKLLIKREAEEAFGSGHLWWLFVEPRLVRPTCLGNLGRGITDIQAQVRAEEIVKKELQRALVALWGDNQW